MAIKYIEHRKGEVGAESVEFTITAEVKNNAIVTAEGSIETPDDFHARYLGTTNTLLDVESGLSFWVHIAQGRFTFKNYDKIEALFGVIHNRAR
ncbi:hypothetical protein [Prosthecochloris sp. CIB 2401]|uniref:hypothetical protein n=1 Tax=Prosthecochloris sp. CIB 2401 TaxID=1868325 RepID=UPI00080AA9CF|nr:hypothetical protein [Prosthecochloris sp. CIB 2401]ANT64618.1 hypothetical protein Ptc2401_00831 [Prosthecochloris sp. CIB 2401]